MSAVIIPVVPAIQLRRILYATDFSEGSKMALPVVYAIARRYGSEVLAAHICSSHSHPLLTQDAVASLSQKEEIEAANELAELSRISRTLHIGTVPVLKTGEPVAELEKIVRGQAVDLAILSTHGRIGVQRVLLGSVAEATLRNLSCPVLTVGPCLDHRFRDAAAIRNILFPTDLSEESGAVFPYLASLAHEYKARITLLHVLPPETETNPDARSLAEPLRRQMQRMFAPQISPDCEAEFLIDCGDAAEEILKETSARGADLIGFGVRRAGGMATHFQTTVTYTVLIHATCPVLTCHHRPGW
jgi:nucleotide-binding universal stress UspA family protein